MRYARFEWEQGTIWFYATFEGFESFCRTGPYAKFSERLDGLVLHVALQYGVIRELIGCLLTDLAATHEQAKTVC